MSQSLTKIDRRRITEYARRNEILRQLGFASYADYLDSPLWQSIRIRVLKSCRYKCCGCGNPATEVHHHAYTPENLTGKNTSCMSGICRKCHRFIEFDRKQQKLPPSLANNRLSKRRRRQKPRRVAKIKMQSRDTLHDAYHAKMEWIKANLKGRKRDTAIGIAIRERSGQINARQRSTDCEPTYSQSDQSVPWDRTQGVGAGEQSPAVAVGKPQSNAARTQGPPIRMGHRPGNTPSNGKLAPIGA